MTTYLSPQHLEVSGYVSLDRLAQEEEQEQHESWRGRRGGARPRRSQARSWPKPLPRPRRRRRTYVRSLIWGANACPCVYNNGGTDDAAADTTADDALAHDPHEEPQEEIVARTSDEMYEMLDEVQRAFHARVTWSAPVPLANARALPSMPGVYMVLRDANPLYVGQSSDVRRRWLGRLETLQQLAIDTSPYTVRVGLIANVGTDGRTAASDSLRRDVEAAVITTTPGALTNRSSKKPFKVGTGGASLRQQEPDGRVTVRQQPPGRIFREW